MSHDIRTPLVGIIGMANLLQQELHRSQEKEYAHMIEMSGEQLLVLFNSILDIVSSDNSKDHAIEKQSFDLYELIKGICELELPTIKIKKLELHLIIDSSVPQWIITDSTVASILDESITAGIFTMKFDPLFCSLSKEIVP